MKDEKKRNEGAGNASGTKAKKKYETPEIVEEGAFETTVLSCLTADPIGCPGSISS